MKKFLIVFAVALTAMFFMPRISEAGIIPPPADDTCSEDTCNNLQAQINGKCSVNQCQANSAAIQTNANQIATKCSQAQCQQNTAAIATKCSLGQCQANTAAIGVNADDISTNADMIDMVKARFRTVTRVCDHESSFVDRIAPLTEESCIASCDEDETVVGYSFSCFNVNANPVNCYRLSVLENGPDGDNDCIYRVVNNNLQNNLVGNARVMLSVDCVCAQVDFP